MNYKLLVYVFNILLCTFAISCINFNKIIKPDKAFEAKIMAVITSCILGYLFTNFIFDF